MSAVTGAPERGLIARGLGRSYGDPAQNAGGRVLDMTGASRILAFDGERGTVTAQAGVSLDALLRTLLPQGWFLPVTPGTRHVTLGGAIASDVHGKNHHRDGSFGAHVERLRLVTADGATHELGPDAELFWATVGGMGLTGVVLDATVRLVPVPSSRVQVETWRCRDLEEVVDALDRADDAPYSVAWLDSLARGRSLGRGVVTAGAFAAPDALAPRERAAPFAYGPRTRLAAPPVVPPGLLNRLSIGAFNEAYHRAAPRHRAAQICDVASFFHPLDAVRGWNTLYGPAGFVQHQAVVPGVDDVRALLGVVTAARAPSFLTVLKRLGPGTAGPLSFPRPGWTLALDLPAGTPGLAATLDRLDELVASAGGAVYLAKDARTRPELMTTFYPQLAQFRALRERVDPARRFVSDQSRRLDL